MIVLGIDALDGNLVEEFGCDNLKLKYNGKTDLSDYSDVRTVPIWASMVAGQNMEVPILAKVRREGNAALWDYAVPDQETVFADFHSVAIDVPGTVHYERKAHAKTRKLLAERFSQIDNPDIAGKIRIETEYRNHVIGHYTSIVQKLPNFRKVSRPRAELYFIYFSIIDDMGHLFFHETRMLRAFYRTMDEIVASYRKIVRQEHMIVISDHGMKPMSPGSHFGEHTWNGYWSTSFADLGYLKPMELRTVISRNI